MTAADGPGRRQAFCARLKDERERRGTSLSDIAESTKVKASLLEGLERGDVSRWPKGLYRRAFFRDYLQAIGLPADTHVGEFLDLFPDGEEHPAGMTPVVPLREPVAPLRLTFAGGDGRSWAERLRTGLLPVPRVLRRQMLAAAIDASLVIALILLAYGLSPARVWFAAAVMAFGYYSTGTVLLGGSPAAWWLRRRPKTAPRKTASTPPMVMDFQSTIAAPTHAPLSLPLGPGARKPSILRSYLNAASRLSGDRSRSVQHDLAEVRRRRMEKATRGGDEVPETIN